MKTDFAAKYQELSCFVAGRYEINMTTKTQNSHNYIVNMSFLLDEHGFEVHNITLNADEVIMYKRVAQADKSADVVFALDSVIGLVNQDLELKEKEKKGLEVRTSYSYH